jgi:hypothetical protein
VVLLRQGMGRRDKGGDMGESGPLEGVKEGRGAGDQFDEGNWVRLDAVLVVGERRDCRAVDAAG